MHNIQKETNKYGVHRPRSTEKVAWAHPRVCVVFGGCVCYCACIGGHACTWMHACIGENACTGWGACRDNRRPQRAFFQSPNLPQLLQCLGQLPQCKTRKIWPNSNIHVLQLKLRNKQYTHACSGYSACMQSGFCIACTQEGSVHACMHSCTESCRWVY